MSLQLFLLLLSGFDVAQCLLSPIARPTNAADDLAGLMQGWTPVPTQAAIAPWVYGASKGKLARRQASSSGAAIATCGWYSGNPLSSITCDPGAFCLTYTEYTPNYIGCCYLSEGEDASTACPYRGTCLNFYDNNNPVTTSSSVVYDGTVYCGKAYPSCYTIADEAADGNTFYYQGCDTDSYDLVASMWTTSSSPSYPPESTTYPPEPTTTTTPIAPVGNANSNPTSPPASPQTSPPTSNPNPQPSHSNTGAIAGGVVGGIVGLALLGCGIGYLIWRKKKQRVQPMPEVSQYGQSPSYGQSHNPSFVQSPQFGSTPQYPQSPQPGYAQPTYQPYNTQGGY